MKKNDLAKLLLEWYAKNGRDLPWRVKGGAHPNPYVILVSEFMLQQTTVKTVIPYFHRFMERFPNVQVLAAAPLDDVYLYWQGLGYYSRARSLHQTVQMIVENYDGEFPNQRAEVLKLKGIGDYTAASFLALAFNQPEAVVDGNVMRIICRMYHWEKPIDEILPLIREKAQSLTDVHQAADYASAIMDLGATICTPKKPQCLLCPWQAFCQSKNASNLEEIPQRRKLEKKEKFGSVYLIYNSLGEIFIRQRTEKGLLSGLFEFPWCDEGKLLPDEACQDSGVEVVHIFTHFKLVLRVYILQAERFSQDGKFVKISELGQYPFSTLMKKVYQKSVAIKGANHV